MHWVFDVLRWPYARACSHLWRRRWRTMSQRFTCNSTSCVSPGYDPDNPWLCSKYQDVFHYVKNAIVRILINKKDSQAFGALSPPSRKGVHLWFFFFTFFFFVDQPFHSFQIGQGIVTFLELDGVVDQVPLTEPGLIWFHRRQLLFCHNRFIAGLGHLFYWKVIA